MELIAKANGMKTYTAAIVTILVAIGGVLEGTIPLEQAVHLSVDAILFMTLRHAVGQQSSKQSK